jgi:galactonate dehydratase
MLLSRNACHFIRPDVCLCGGLTHAKKIAAVAEAYGALVVPHNPLSPVSTAACIQLAAAIPNFAIQEYPIGENLPPKSLMVTSVVRLEKGFLIVPDAPGIGVELSPDAERLCPYRPRDYVTRLHEDGSVFDQ